MADIHLVVPPLHEAGEIVVHVVEHHVDAALHVVGFECCRQTDGIRWYGKNQACSWKATSSKSRERHKHCCTVLLSSVYSLKDCQLC